MEWPTSSRFSSGVIAAHRAQADALEIEAMAKRRLADEYDAAQERGEVATGHNGPGAGILNGNTKATIKEIGITSKQIHEARQVRDAEQREPGVVRHPPAIIPPVTSLGPNGTRHSVGVATEEILI